MVCLDGLLLLRFVAFALAVLSLGGAADDEQKSDDELLKLAQNRNQLERITADPVVMFPQVMLLCRPPTTAAEKDLPNPHSGQSVHVYASPDAVAPMWDLYGVFPVGSILLKQKLDPENSSKATLFTGMIKRDKGFFPDGGDWEYFTLDGELSKVTSRGKLETCAACHRDFAEWDFVSKQYTSVPVALREYASDQGIANPVIAAGSSSTFYLPASRAETHGPRLSRKEAEQKWWQSHAGSADAAPQDLSAWGGPTLRYELGKHKNTLGYWTHVSDSASWVLDVRKPGVYTVSILQGCGEGSGGADVEIQLGDQVVPFVVEETGGFQNFKWRDVGEMTVDLTGTQTLTVKPRSKPGHAVMDLRQIILRPK